MTDTPLAICSLPIVCNDERYREQAALLAQKLQQPLLLNAEPQALMQSDFVLLLNDQGVALQQTGRKAPGPIRAEFVEGSVDHRRKFGGGKGQMIAKAVGVKSGVYPRVLDATAGLGKDAFVLATLGCHVQLLERSLVVHAMLQDGITRAWRAAEHGDPELMEILQRMELLSLDSRDHLKQWASLSQLSPETIERPDVIYLDPMFPERGKSADVKKDMRAFHTVVGKDEDADELLSLALEVANYRVVVKRSRKAPFISAHKPSYQLEGKSSRYDIYALKKMPEHLPISSVRSVV